MSDEFDVAVIGYGPSGAVAAGLLGGMGVRVLVCDRSRDIYPKPRAIALDHEILRVFQQLGVVEEVLRHAEPFTPSEFHGVDGRLIKRFHTAEPPYPLGYVPSMVFDQPSVERILREHVGVLSTVDVRLATTLVGMDQHRAGVTLALRPDQEPAYRAEARHVVGCDGASSTVRQLLGIALEDLGFDEPWLVVDLMVNDGGLAKLPVVSKQYCEPSRPSSYIIGPGHHRRWEISINPGEEPDAVATPESTWSLLSRWLTPDDATLWRQAAYRFHALVAHDWRWGRVFLAGDAAHQQPPFLGQGMCQGIRDVANLAWKLEAVLAGRASDGLLDTYGEERKGHVTELTRRIREVGRLVGERDPDAARARDARLLAECGGVVESVPRQEVQPPLAEGLIAEGGHPAVGTVFPQPWVTHDHREGLLDEMMGCGWRLMISPGADPGFDDLLGAASPVPVVPVRFGPPGATERDGVVAEWFRRNRCAAALVRPDHYVHSIAENPGELETRLTALAENLERTHPGARVSRLDLRPR